jgi:hypothetical protein
MSASAKGSTSRMHAVTAPQAYTVAKQSKSRWWEVRDPAGLLVCLTVYKRGAMEVVRRLTA